MTGSPASDKNLLLQRAIAKQALFPTFTVARAKRSETRDAEVGTTTIPEMPAEVV
jgi:hypothetical protein